MRVLRARNLLALFTGMRITIRHLLRGLMGKGTATIEYPEVKRQYSTRFRGAHQLVLRPDGSPRCVACMLCATACPADCIHIVAGEYPDTRIEKYPVSFQIDMLRCVFCGFCVDACPEEAIIMRGQHEMAFFTKGEEMWDLVKLSRRPELHTEPIGYRPQDLAPDHGTRQAVLAVLARGPSAPTH